MGIFVGTYYRSLDEKGRLLIPSKLKSEGTTSYFMLKGFEGCIAVYEKDEFERLIASLKALDFKKEENRAYIRLASASINELPLDSHNRVLIGKGILDNYRIGNDVTIIGVLDHFEIWDNVAYAQYQIANDSHYEELAERSN